MNIEHYVDQQGSGAPIVFIHGSYATTATWKKQVAELAKTHHCISIKLPGHGGAPAAQDFDAPTIETELAIIEQVIAATTDQPIHLVGHSYGGVVALALALKGSVRLSQMTLFEPVAVWLLDKAEDRDNQERVNAFLNRYRRDAAANQPQVHGQVLDFWGEPGAFDVLPAKVQDAMAPLLRDNLRHWDNCTVSDHQLADLDALALPARVVCGSRSNPVAQAITALLVERLPLSRGYEIDGASHFMVSSHPDACLQILQDPLPNSLTYLA